MWKCPNCETNNEGDTCMICGEHRVAETKPFRSKSVVQNGTVCWKCKTVNRKNSKFCERCGAKLNSENKTRDGVKNVAIAVATFFAVVFFIAVAIVIFVNLFDGEPFNIKNIYEEVDYLRLV